MTPQYNTPIGEIAAIAATGDADYYELHSDLASYYARAVAARPWDLLCLSHKDLRRAVEYIRRHA